MTSIGTMAIHSIKCGLMGQKRVSVRRYLLLRMENYIITSELNSMDQANES